MLDRIRVSVRYGFKGLIVITPDFAEVGNIMLNRELFRLPSAPEHNMHKLRLDALDLCEEVRIEAELNDRSCFGGACELSFDHLVRPSAEGAERVDAHKKVGTTPPELLLKHALIDNGNTPAQCF